MLEQILNRVARRHLEREVHNWLCAVAEFCWPAATFQSMAEQSILPMDLDVPLPVLRLLQGQTGAKARQVLDLFTDAELMALLDKASPPHGEIMRTYPVWAEAFVQDLRHLITAKSATPT